MCCEFVVSSGKKEWTTFNQKCSSSNLLGLTKFPYMINNIIRIK